jgi:hypothetical protein
MSQKVPSSSDTRSGPTELGLSQSSLALCSALELLTILWTAWDLLTFGFLLLAKVVVFCALTGLALDPWVHLRKPRYLPEPQLVMNLCVGVFEQKLRSS